MGIVWAFFLGMFFGLTIALVVVNINFGGYLASAVARYDTCVSTGAPQENCFQEFIIKPVKGETK